jgi:DNA-binding response OmpR family regulator
MASCLQEEQLMAKDRQPCILIVEDDLDLADMLDIYFRVQGYQVLTAAQGEEAVQVARQRRPDLVVLDIRLPDIDGYEVCRRLLTSRKTHDLPIIFLTEKRDRTDKLQGLELGVVDYITKPFDVQELRLRIQNALRRARIRSSEDLVTNLPVGEAVDERLQKLLDGEADTWALLVVMLHGLNHFRDKYGFIAGDDVLRAVGLMIANAAAEVGDPADFVGHIGAENFVVATSAERIQPLRERIVERLGRSIDYFYPLRDRESLRTSGAERLGLTFGALQPSDGPFESVEALKAAALKALTETPTPE